MAEQKKQKRYNATIKITRDQGARAKPHTHWHKVGVAYETRTGSINLILTSMPVLPSQWDGTIVLFEDDKYDSRNKTEAGPGLDDDNDYMPEGGYDG